MRITKDEFHEINAVDPGSGIYQISSPMFVWCIEGDPRRALVFRTSSIQGNSSKKIAETIGKQIVREFPTASLVKIERPHIPWES